MESKTRLEEAQLLFGDNFIGTDVLNSISKELGISTISEPVPPITFSKDELKRFAEEDYLLILGIPQLANGHLITINELVKKYGKDPNKNEPCFYNQDWYVSEEFVSNRSIEFKWYLVGKNLTPQSRGKELDKAQIKNLKLPSAILCVYTFFVYFLANQGSCLWKNDFVWCDDQDHNGDRIYIGKYIDPNGVNKNGLEIHRHLSLTLQYGCIGAY